MADAIRGARYAVLPNGPHMPFVEMPQDVANMLVPFFQGDAGLASSLPLDLHRIFAVVDPLHAFDIERRVQHHAVHVDLRLIEPPTVHVVPSPKVQRAHDVLASRWMPRTTGLALTPTEAWLAHVAFRRLLFPDSPSDARFRPAVDVGDAARPHVSSIGVSSRPM